MPVGRRANSHGKQPLAAQLLANLPKQRSLIAHCAIGDENHLTHARSRFSLHPTVQRPGQGRRHFRSAISPKAIHVLTGSGKIIAGGHFRLHEQGVRLAVELDHVETVPWCQCVQPRLKRTSGLSDRLPRHGTGGVDYKHQIPRQHH